MKESYNMEIVLLEDVKALGKKGQIVKVNDGYARNFILPKKLGVEANAKNLNDLKLQQAHADKVAAEQLAAASTRVAPTCSVMGEAAGTAAAMTVKYGVTASEVNVPELQDRLRAAGGILE